MAGKQNYPKHPDGSHRLPGFFDDYGGSGVRLLPDTRGKTTGGGKSSGGKATPKKSGGKKK